VVEQARTLNRL